MSSKEPAELLLPCEAPELPPELQYAILAEARRPLLSRQLSSQLSAIGAQQLERLIFARCDSASTVRSLVGWCTALRELDLRRVACVDDQLVAWILENRPRLALLDVSESAGERLTARSLALFRAMTPSLEWRAAGCWRMHSAHLSLSAREVVAFQVLALRGDEGSGDGVAACFSFASPANRMYTGPADRFGRMIRASYGCMMQSRTARIACVAGGGDADTTSTFLVSFEAQTADADVLSGSWLEVMGMEEPQTGHLFHWELSRQRDGEYDGCWMTDGVGQIEQMHMFPFMDPARPADGEPVQSGENALPGWREQVVLSVV